MAAAVAGRLGHRVLERPELVAVDGGESRRRVLSLAPWPDPPATAAALETFFGPGRGPVVVEDAFGGLDLSPHGYAVADRMTVMALDPARADPPAGAAEVDRAADPELFAVAEGVIREGFPMRVGPGRLLDAALLALPGLTLWLGRRGGAPAGAVAAFAGGGATGIYYLATLPEHRGHGVARALMAAALTAHAERTVTLTATVAGEPLYRALGFAAVGRATWWRR